MIMMCDLSLALYFCVCYLQEFGEEEGEVSRCGS